MAATLPFVPVAIDLMPVAAVVVVSALAGVVAPVYVAEEATNLASGGCSSRRIAAEQQ